MQWYYTRSGQQQGPVELAELVRMARSGELLPTDYVWNQTMGAQWAPASTIPDIFAAPPVAGIPPAIPTTPVIPAAPLGPRGQTHNRELMRMARESLRGQWGISIAAFVVYFLCIGVASGIIPFVGGIIGLIVGGPLIVGFCRFFLAVARQGKPDIGDLFEGFKSFGNALAAYLLVGIFVMLWTLLLIIPGIIAQFSYAMTFYILADNPNIGASEAIRRSKEMMYGNRWKLFCLSCRFIGWALLCIPTCFIGYLWLVPYVQTSLAHFYDDVRKA